MSRLAPHDRNKPVDIRALAEDVERVGAELRLLATPEPEHSGISDADRAVAVRRYLRARRLRERLLPADLFADPAWDMLLDLYAAEFEGKRVFVTSACLAAVVPTTTGLRWISRLIEYGLIRRREDMGDGRRGVLEITPDARNAINRWVELSLFPADDQ
ncbi:MAG: hypothetical protein ACOY45_04465 [Pseudomonadota bacterium]